MLSGLSSFYYLRSIKEMGDLYIRYFCVLLLICKKLDSLLFYSATHAENLHYTVKFSSKCTKLAMLAL